VAQLSTLGHKSYSAFCGEVAWSSSDLDEEVMGWFEWCLARASSDAQISAEPFMSRRFAGAILSYDDVVA
jgi:hypothetical protein